MSRDFLFEIGCEELPSGSVLPLAEALEAHLTNTLQQASLSFTTKRCFATPRRLAVLITGLEEKQPPKISFRRGPTFTAAYDPEGNPTPALLGFARSCGTTHEMLSEQITDKGHWVGYELETQGIETRELLGGWIRQALDALPIKKPMHWGEAKYSFVRPVHWIVMLWGDEVLEEEFLGVRTDRLTYGHRFHHPHAIPLRSTSDYVDALTSAFVMADFGERRNVVRQQILDLGTTHHATPIISEPLLEEVTSIVEWPNALLCNFSPSFLTVPQEALIASMQSHQKCFPLADAAGRLLPAFIAVTNIQSQTAKEVIVGNEKVMRARLSDASFFFNTDKKYSLTDRIESTKKVLFQDKLGSLYDKSKRIQTIMQSLSTPFDLKDQELERASALSKCDLMTGMVSEFPELEGTMGYYYAVSDGEPLPVAIALQEQYLPRFSGDNLPLSPLGTALSLADRADTLAGIFALGYRASGTSDPFKLRRHSLAIGRILLGFSKAPISLSSLLNIALNNFVPNLVAQDEVHNLVNELVNFIFDRLQPYYHTQGVASDCFLATRARQTDWLFDFDKRLVALLNFAHTADAGALSASCKRVTRLLQQAGDPLEQDNLPDDGLFIEDAEKNLWRLLQNTKQALLPLYAASDYSSILAHLATLRPPIDDFFEQVMIMVDNPLLKRNRLQLLSCLDQTLQGVAEIGLLQTEPR